jgi:hypothetical protein
LTIAILDDMHGRKAELADLAGKRNDSFQADIAKKLPFT